jgi:4a-hydroxytetrahydrobiopterin dehydratase
VPQTPLLTEDELTEALSAPGGPRWQLSDGVLVKTVVCEGFPQALTFVGQVGRLAEERDHHPDIDIRYNRVILALSTHDSGGITRLDVELARAIDALESPEAD